GLDVRAGLVMEGRLVAPFAAARQRHGNALCELLPALVVEAQAVIESCLPRTGESSLIAAVRKRRPRLRLSGVHGVEDVEQPVEAGHRLFHRRGVAERKLEEAAREPELAAAQLLAQLVLRREVARRPEV